jgi:hypothetical protein
MFGLIVMPLLGADEVWQLMTAFHDEGENFVSDTYCRMTLKALWRFFRSLPDMYQGFSSLRLIIDLQVNLCFCVKLPPQSTYKTQHFCLFHSCLQQLRH